MIDVLKQSSEQYRSILQRQIDTLETLLSTLPKMRDEHWRARHDIALALARDAIKRVVPPDSALFELFAKTASAPPEGQREEISPREFELLRSAIANITWNSTDNTAGAMPATNSLFSDVERMLPQMVYRHPAFKVLFTLLVALVGVATFGVFKFYNISIDIGHEIRTQQAKLTTDFAHQRAELESFLAKNRSEATSISEQLNLVGGKLAEAKKQIGLIETDAQATVARFAAQANRNVDSESSKALDTLRIGLDQRQKIAVARIDEYFEKDAAPQLKVAAEKRVDQILTDPGKPFIDKLKSFEERVTVSQKLMSEIEGRQKAIEGKHQLTEKAYSLLPQASPSVVDRLASYIGEALWVIYCGAILMVLFVLTNIWVLWRSRK